MVIDENVLRLHGDAPAAYFDAHDIALTVVPVRIAETAKSLRTLETIVDAFADFGLNRKERVLVVGGGLTTDVAGFACASYKRSTDYVRIPTTLIGLIDASVSIKVGANHGKHKNRLGAYHASKQVLARLLAAPHAARRPGAQRDRRDHQDRDGRRTSASSRPWRSTPTTCCTPRSATPRVPSTCGRWPTRSPTTPSAPCSSSRCPTSTSSTSTG